MNVNVGHGSALSLSSLAKGIVTLDLKNGLSTGNVDSQSSKPIKLNSAVNCNVQTPSKNLLLSVVLNMLSGSTLMRMINNGNFRGDLYFQSLANIKAYTNGSYHVIPLSIVRKRWICLFVFYFIDVVSIVFIYYL